MHRAKYESHFDFILSQEALDRACNQVDMKKHWQIQRAKTKEKVENRKEKWGKKSRQLRARRLFQQEQKRMCSLERERQHAYHAARQRAQGEQELQQRQENVRMTHVLKAIMRGWREGKGKTANAKDAENEGGKSPRMAELPGVGESHPFAASLNNEVVSFDDQNGTEAFILEP